MTKDRLRQLDGLRGVAALSVVIFHFMSALTPFLVAEQQSNAHWISYSPVAVIWNGTFAVSIFFVLSGFVLTNAAMSKIDPLLINLVIRYLRLAIPALCSSCLGWLLLKIFPTESLELQRLTHSRWLLWTYQGDIPNFATAIYSGAVDIFLSGGSYFNNVLWTMRPELFGSAICFVVCSVKCRKNRLLMTSLVAILLFIGSKYEYECFIIGIYLREAWDSGKLNPNFSTLAIILGLIIGSQSGDAAKKIGLDWLPDFLALGTKSSMLYPAAAGLLVYGVIHSKTVARLLSGRLGVFLGTISFPIYLIHVPIIYTVFSYIFLNLANYKIAQYLSVLFVFILLILFAYIAEILLERPFLMKLGKLRFFLNEIYSRLKRRY